ncbi:MAG: hypothetical protein KAT65_27220 [Methanophagales archaeon]|nr:hypothetical protein [Methanophagales archaeon]
MDKGFAQELLTEEHSVGLHTIHRKDYKDFSGDLNTISKRFDGGVYGFTKHRSERLLQSCDILKGME